MIKFIIYGDNKKQFIQKVNELDPTVRWQATITEYKSKRTNDQNKWLRAYAKAFGDNFGYEPDEAYDMLMYKHNPVFIVDKESGEEIRTCGHFSKLNTKQAAEVQEAILRYGEQLGFFWSE